MKRAIINFLRHLLYARLFFKLEFKKNKSLGWRAIIKSWPKGFLSISPLIYDFENNDSDHFISDWNRLRYSSRINDKRAMVLNEKLLFHIMNKDNKHVLPIVSLIKNRKIFIGSLDHMEDVSIDGFCNFVRQFETGLIIKPLTGGGGAGISKAIWNGETVVFSGSCESINDFVKIVNSGKDYLMTEIILQTGMSHSIFPDTINSIRIVTMIDPETNKPFIATVVHRFGVARSGIVDNWSAGGLSVKIDLNSGVMGKGAVYPKEGNMQWYPTHPETNAQIEGEKIENWDQIKASVLDMAQQYFYLPYVGWDVVPMDDGHIFLEGNSNSDVNLLQIHDGFLKNEAVKRFFDHYYAIVN